LRHSETTIPDCERLHFDIPDAYLPEYPPPLIMTTHKELGDVSDGLEITLGNYYEIFDGLLTAEQMEGLKELLRPSPTTWFNQTEHRVTAFDLTTDGDLYLSVTLPSLTVGTVGGGTQLGTSLECLQMLACAGDGGARKFAEIIAATVLAGELSIGAAIASGEMAEAHESYGRNRPDEIGLPDRVDAEEVMVKT
jgi:hypothetical protein